MVNDGVIAPTVRPLAFFKPSSYAFFTSAFFHSMIASARSRSRYLSNSALRLSVKTRLLISCLACSNDCVSGAVDRFELENLVALGRSQDLRDVAHLHRLDQLAQIWRHVAQIERTDEPGVGSRRSVGDIGRQFFEALAGDGALTNLVGLLARLLVTADVDRRAVARHVDENLSQRDRCGDVNSPR